MKKMLLSFAAVIGLLICVFSANAQTQNVSVRGTVYDIDNIPVVGASVEVLGLPQSGGVITDLDGNFTLSNIPSSAILRVACMGLVTQEISLKGQTFIKVVLKQDAKYLDGVVVTALGIKRSEKALSYNVQEIKSNALTTVKDANFINSLNGKVAGVSINKSGAGVGGATRVVMRGAKSIEGNNNVLYVVDGIPIFNTSVGEDSGIMGEGRVGSEGIADFNPEDIESISVLSGPSAAALYGSNAANGAILITTKKGEAGSVKVGISSSFEWSNPFVMPRFQNTYGNKPGTFESWGDKLDTPTKYNPAKDFFNTGTNIINSVALTTGNEKNQIYASLSTTNAGGIVPNNKYERYNFTVRNTSNFFNNALQVSLGAQYIKQKDRNMVSQGQCWNPIVAAYLFPRGENFDAIRTFERWDSSRNIGVQYWPLGEGTYGVQNPYWTAYRNIAQNNKDRYIFTADAKYNILKWLNVSARFRMDKAHTYFNRNLYASTNEKWSEKKGHFEYANTDDNQYYADAMLNMDKAFGKFNVVANFGISYSDYASVTRGLGGPLSLVPNLFTIQNLNPNKSKPIEKGGDTPVRNFAMFGSVEAGWNNMVFLTLTGRNDWNSRLVNSKEPSFFYPSVGLSALISEMMPMPKWIDLIKVRGSYTQVGAPVSKLGLTPGTYTDELVGGVLKPSTIYPYGDFKAERTKSFELGLTARLLYGLHFDFTWYKSNTYNQTFLGTMPESSGYTKAYLQAGNVQNTGIEASLGYDNTWGDFGFSTNMTISANKNVIKEMVKNYKHPNLPNVFDIPEVTKGSTILKVGGSINDVYANTFFKKDNQGHVYVPESGNITMEPGKPVFLGKTTPDFTMGWNFNFSYKGVSLDLLFNGRFGGIVTSSTQAILDRFGVSEASALARDRGGVQIPHQGLYDAKTYYSLVGTGEAQHAGYYTYSATNVRLQQMALSYAMPAKWFKGHIRGITLSLIGNNLWMIYNKAPHDPELTPTTGTYGIGNDYFMQPSLRSFGFSIKLNI